MEKIKSYHTIKKLEIGKTKIELCIKDEPINEEQEKNQLIKIYDLVNEISRRLEKSGIDTANWFYTDNQIKKMKNCPENKFI